MASYIFWQPIFALPLIILNLVTMHWVRQHQYGQRVGVTCNNVVLSMVFAIVAIFSGMIFVSIDFLSMLVVIFALDSFMLMLWVVWELVYIGGERYR